MTAIDPNRQFASAAPSFDDGDGLVLIHLSLDNAPNLLQRFLLGAWALSGLSACQPYLVDAADEAELIRLGDFSCESPYELSQDCKSKRNAQLTVVIDEIRFQIAGSEDGTIVFFEQTTGDMLKSEFGWDFLFLGTADFHGRRLAKIYEVVERTLEKSSVQVTSAGPVVSSVAETVGYVLELDGDGYSVLRGYEAVEN